MKYVHCLLFTLVSSSFAIAGSISGGGGLPYVTQPREYYEYRCQFEIQHTVYQSGSGRVDCGVVYKAQAILRKIDNPSGALKGPALKDMNFVRDSNWDSGSCDKNLDFVYWDNSFYNVVVALVKGPGHFYGKFTTEITLKIAPYSTNGHAGGTSHTVVKYDDGYIEDEANYADGDSDLTLRASCQRRTANRHETGTKNDYP